MSTGDDDEESIAMGDFSSAVVSIQRSNDFVRSDSSSDITFDSSSEHDGSSSSEEEENNKYAEYFRMLTASNQEDLKEVSKSCHQKDRQGSPTRSQDYSQWQRRQLTDMSQSNLRRSLSAENCPLFARALPCKKLPSANHKRETTLDDSFVTELTASMTSLGSGMFRWSSYRRNERHKYQKAKETTVIPPKRNRIKSLLFPKASCKPSKKGPTTP